MAAAAELPVVPLQLEVGVVDVSDADPVQNELWVRLVETRDETGLGGAQRADDGSQMDRPKRRCARVELRRQEHVVEDRGPARVAVLRAWRRTRP